VFDPESIAVGTVPAPRTCEVRAGDAADLLRAMPDRSVDLVFTSPPYEDARTYEAGMPGAKKFKLRGQAWVDWLAPLVAECCRVSRGLAVVNVSGVVRKHRYSGAVEMLVADLIRLHGIVCGPAPYAWTKNGIPGSGSKESGYHRRDWEPVYCFALPDRLPLAFKDQLAFGRPPKYRSGGRMTNRGRSGRRAGASGCGVMARTGAAGQPPIACPSNLIHAKVGGGHLGTRKAHAGEAPMPESLAERFVCWYAPPGGLVLDPFAGTGTTLAAAAKHGRRGLGFELRPHMAEVARRRLSTTQAGLF
jgi:hypothetical protein